MIDVKYLPTSDKEISLMDLPRGYLAVVQNAGASGHEGAIIMKVFGGDVIILSNGDKWSRLNYDIINHPVTVKLLRSGEQVILTQNA